MYPLTLTKKEALNLLERMMQTPNFIYEPCEISDLEYHAARFLYTNGLIARLEAGQHSTIAGWDVVEGQSWAYTLTEKGWAYYERERNPIRYWLKNNWFPFAIAVITSIIGVANIVGNI